MVGVGGCVFSRGVHMSVVCEVRLGEEVRLVDSYGRCWRVGV